MKATRELDRSTVQIIRLIVPLNWLTTKMPSGLSLSLLQTTTIFLSLVQAKIVLVQLQV
jgi:hypothetical protein